MNGTLQAQQDTIHWIPPMYAEGGECKQYIYLTTTETNPFEVKIHDGGGHLVKSAQISNTQPLIYLLSDTYSQLLVADIRVGIVLPSEGLVISGPKPFLASFRSLSAGDADAGQLTCKGRAALGKIFRIGHLKQVTDKTGARSNFIGVLATEDNTQVTLSQFDPTTNFSGLTFVDPDGKVHVTLQKGQSITWAHLVGGIEDEQPRNAFMGALVEATRPVAVNCGSWMGGPVVYGVNDIAADQIVPLERVGKEYILSRGSGPISLEHAIIVAHENGTEVWINGISTPVAVLNAGQYAVLPTNTYSPDGILYIKSSKPVFVYHMTGGVLDGKYSLRQACFSFVPPINCGLPHAVGPVIQPIRIQDVRFDGNLSIIAVRDSAVTLLVNGAPKLLPAPITVPGNPDFVVYRQVALFNHTQSFQVSEISVQSSAAIQVEFVNYWKDAGFSALYSGFEARPPAVHLMQKGDGVCPDTLVANGNFDGLKWIYDGEEMQMGPDSQFLVQAPGLYKAIGYIGGCFSTATVIDSIEVSLKAPTCTYNKQDVTCFGDSNGKIVFGTPDGGVPPYLYSISEEDQFGTESSFTGLAAGNYKLIVQDAIGCYNEPIHLQILQPDSLYVHLSGIGLPHPFLAGDEAKLGASPSRPVESFTWTPEPVDSCFNCPVYTFYPEYSTWVRVVVKDAAGCRAEDNFHLLVDPRIFAPNAIKPEVSGENSRFLLYSKDILPIRYLRVFDRWGDLVFERRNTETNNFASGWDGYYRDRPAAGGVYVFMAEIEIEPGRMLRLNGSFAIIR